MAAGGQQTPGFLDPDDGSDRNAPAQALGQGDDVCLDAVRVGEPSSGAPHTRLDLVDHEQRIKPFAQGAGASQEGSGDGNNAGLALDGLDEDRRNVVVEDGVEGLDAGVDEDDVTAKRLEGLADGGFVGDGQGAERAPVKAALERDDRSSRLVQASHLDGGLVGLGSRVTEEDPG